MENFIYSQALNSEDEVLKRLNSDFSALTKDADLALLKQKLADIYAISSVDDMYKKMGELMYDGYQTPFVFTCMSNERSVRPYLKQVFEGIDASSSHFEDFAGISETEANLIVDVVKRWKDECWQKEEAESNKMSHYLKELNVVEVSFPQKTRADATSPLEAILTSMGLTSNDIKLLADKDYKYYDAFLSKLSLDDLKRFSVYMVVNRDLRFIPFDSQRDYMASFVYLTLGYNNPLTIRLSSIFNKKIPAANRAAAITMANEFRDAFRERMNKLSWMSADTRAKAIEKLDNMILQIGWPDDDSRNVQQQVMMDDLFGQYRIGTVLLL